MIPLAGPALLAHPSQGACQVEPEGGRGPAAAADSSQQCLTHGQVQRTQAWTGAFTAAQQGRDHSDSWAARQGN